MGGTRTYEQCGKKKRTEPWLENKTAENRRKHVQCRNRQREKVSGCKRMNDVRLRRQVYESSIEK